MINFIVKSRKDIEEGFFPGGRSILVSITDPDKGFPNRTNWYENTLWVKFDDADTKANENTVLIGSSIARSIYRFVNRYVLDGIENVVVHCEAGMSRSAGAAAALSKIFNNDDSLIVKNKPFYNRKVYREIMDFYLDVDIHNHRHH